MDHKTYAIFLCDEKTGWPMLSTAHLVTVMNGEYQGTTAEKIIEAMRAIKENEIKAWNDRA